MPRSGAGVMAWPAGTNAVTNTPISSVAYNAFLADLLADENAPRPVSAGGTGEDNVSDAFAALSPTTTQGDIIKRGAATDERLGVGIVGALLGSNGTDPLWRVPLDAFNDIKQAASESATGAIGIASEAENAARTNALEAVVPKYNPLPSGFIFGCTLSNGTDATNDIDIAAGKARDSADATNILATAITKRLDAAWAVGTNQGGRDTGSIANTTYHVWLIKRTDGTVVDVLFSTSATAPTMPTDYTFKRRIGSIVRSGATILGFDQIGDEFLLLVPVQDEDRANPGTSAVTVTTTVPTGVKVQANVSLSLLSDGGEDRFLLITSPDQTNTAATNNLYDVHAGSAAHLNSVAMLVRTNTSGQIRYRVDSSSSGTSVNILTHGWVDTRGRV